MHDRTTDVKHHITNSECYCVSQLQLKTNYPLVFVCFISYMRKLINSEEHSTHMAHKRCITDMQCTIYNKEEKGCDTNQFSGLEVLFGKYDVT